MIDQCVQNNPYNISTPVEGRHSIRIFWFFDDVILKILLATLCMTSVTLLKMVRSLSKWRSNQEWHSISADTVCKESYLVGSISVKSFVYLLWEK